MDKGGWLFRIVFSPNRWAIREAPCVIFATGWTTVPEPVCPGGPQLHGRAMDSYIVRIYRRGGKKSRILVGTVEVAWGEGKMAFSDIEELWEILRRRQGRVTCPPPPPGRRSRKEVMSATAASGTGESAEGVRQIKPTSGFSKEE